MPYKIIDVKEKDLIDELNKNERAGFKFIFYLQKHQDGVSYEQYHRILLHKDK